MKGNLWIVAVLIVVLTVGAVALPGLLSEVGTTATVTDETQVLTVGGTQLDEAGGVTTVLDNETLVDSETGETLERGENYTLDRGDGILAANDTQDADREVDVTYSVKTPEDERTDEIGSILALLNPVWGLLVVLAALATLWGLVTAWW